ncbi:MAG: type 4a pilus biogenesis protein PilO [Aquificaceae bacterium]
MTNIKEQFSALPKWQIYTLIILIGLFIPGLIWLQLVSPLKQEVDRKKSELKNLESEVMNLQRSVDRKNIEKLKSDLQQFDSLLSQKRIELESIVGELPSSNQLSKVIRNIGVVGKKSGITLNILQISQPQKAYFQVENTATGEKLVKEIPPPEQQQQPQGQQKAQNQPQAPPPNVVTLLRSEVRMNIQGRYDNVNRFLKLMKDEGVVSYPASLTLSPDGADIIRGEMVIYLIFKEGG